MQARAIGLVFAVDSGLFAAWLSRIPAIKIQFGLSDGTLGLLLFGMPLGLLALNPFAGRITAHWGAARACIISGMLFAGALLIPAFAPNIWVLFLGLMACGMASALINVAMNTVVTLIEARDKINIMSTCHGMWSLGGMVSALVASVLIRWGVPTAPHLVGASALMLLILAAVRPQLRGIPAPPADGGAKFVWPDRNLLLLILIGIFSLMAEGVAFDWSGVYLQQVAGAAPQTAALGFAFFSGAMTLARFTGDAIIPKFGERRMLTVGGLTAAAGLVLAIALPFVWSGLVGFLLLGAGCALGAPILFSASMRLPGVAPAAGLATYATFSFLGFLAGPPLIGLVAEVLGLASGLGLVAILLCVGVLLLRWTKI